jgi:ribonuclease HI
MKQVTLISEGDCLGIPGPGGWAYILRYGEHSTERTGGSKKPDVDLWQKLDRLAEKHIIRGQWVMGHSGHPDNERCNELALTRAVEFSYTPWRDAARVCG